MERILSGQTCSVSDEAVRIVRQTGRKYTERILSAIMECGFDLQAVPSVFLGGGTKIFRRFVTPQDRLCRLTALTDVNLNAAGFEWLAGQMSKR